MTEAELKALHPELAADVIALARTEHLPLQAAFNILNMAPLRNLHKQQGKKSALFPDGY